MSGVNNKVPQLPQTQSKPLFDQGIIDLNVRTTIPCFDSAALRLSGKDIDRVK